MTLKGKTDMPTRRRASAFLIRILLMWISLLLFSVIFGAIPSAMAQPQLFPQPLSPRIANYDIDVSLDTKIRTLRGNEIVKWKNSSPEGISELHLHLYMNAFRNNKSTFMKEASGPPRGGKIEKDSWGYIEVRKIGLSSGADLTGAMQFIHPDDDNADDKTVIRLPLPKPVLQGDSVSLTVDFVEKLPQPPLARTGAKEEYFFVGQWFPKMGVYIDGKGHCHQFHANSEFFADFGVYNVHMTVPEKNIVGATGVQGEVKNNGDGADT